MRLFTQQLQYKHRCNASVWHPMRRKFVGIALLNIEDEPAETNFSHGGAGSQSNHTKNEVKKTQTRTSFHLATTCCRSDLHQTLVWRSKMGEEAAARVQNKEVGTMRKKEKKGQAYR